MKLIVSMKCCLHGRDINIPHECEQREKGRGFLHLPNIISSHPHPWLHPEKFVLSRKRSGRTHIKAASVASGRQKKRLRLEFLVKPYL